ncbi:hypothetical protein PPTG_22971 [Phytophthora nicotianae INRA-310]|uniref:Uncharacterized protein n=1 Tax=Phytophthora nicotianae (strain INRA-310) TaxID=761204 RepID=W2Q6J0_PHYN3|nr:hypothetical protein PPTG_22971 [Phytophthora nicotianae INRA-310]ETN08767.1 hypothetical protein PPTG_22971 [Phytophthora nicotianae INRA-310]
MASSPEKKQKTASISTASSLLRFYRTPAFTAHANRTLLAYLRAQVGADAGLQVDELVTEYCFYVETKADAGPLSAADQETLHWLLSETFEPQQTRPDQSFLATTEQSKEWLVEVGPRMNFSTAWSSNAVAICQACGISAIKRIERATRYLVRYTATKPEAVEALKQALLRHECDRMTQQVYEEPLTSFWHGKTVQPVRKIPIMERGIDALKEINEEIGLGFDDWDLQYYLNLFKEKLKRNPTDVECFDMGQSNSEHSRHWFFGGKIVVDGKEMPQTLFQMVKNTLTENAKKNSVIAFHDNSSVIKGANIVTLGPVNPGEPSAVQERTLDSHLLLTAETHNFPSGVAPFPGAETGTGGRIRDVQATGRGANVVAGVSAYSVAVCSAGSIVTTPLSKLEATCDALLMSKLSTGIDTGNATSVRTYSSESTTGNAPNTAEAVSIGDGASRDARVLQGAGDGRLSVVRPAVECESLLGVDLSHIAENGGASVTSATETTHEGHLYCVVEGSLPAATHWQAAAGQHATEVEAIFSKLNVPLVKLGKVTTDGAIKVSVNGESVLEDQMADLRDVWEATSFELEKRQCNPECVAQEQRSLRTRTAPSWKLSYEPKPTPERQLSTRAQHRVAVLREEGSNGEREMLAAFHHAGFEVWDVTMSDLVNKRIVLDERFRGVAFVGGFTFADVLGSAKGWSGVVKFHGDVLKQFAAFKARDDTFSFGACNGCQFMTLLGWLDRPEAKALEEETKTSAQPRFVHNESGRHESRFVSVQIQESNAVMLRGMAGSSLGVWVSHGEGRAHFTHPKIQEKYVASGAAAIRYVDDSNVPTEEYPFNPNGSPQGIAGLVSSDGRHMCLMPHPERCFLKYQWPYMPAEFEAHPVGVAVDGGKDSLSMAAKVNKKDVKTPGTLVITMYAPTEDVELKVTPDLKTHAGDSFVYYVDVGKGANRLGGSALAQVYGQVGNESPDVEDAELFKNAFNAIQTGIKNGHLLAGHDRSDGGLIVTLLEMAFAGNCGLDVDIPFAGGKATTNYKLCRGCTALH